MNHLSFNKYQIPELPNNYNHYHLLHLNMNTITTRVNVFLGLGQIGLLDSTYPPIKLAVISNHNAVAATCDFHLSKLSIPSYSLTLSSCLSDPVHLPSSTSIMFSVTSIKCSVASKKCPGLGTR